ncbi:hypothetical protein DEU56DRAFT_929173 [Suillus clintonianus]|uniref:uncharacterized protein n=1 Tax=Suillus clintonianus TaxID=1904413 RepID=UPI001B885D46|nr:uncharacterized protein DEU56DRAFT_929173 [Suillus clintonianus]KAG2147525.1 hypothetical protein DEU56DRAFT_929173 [Suillus clintonianus]
MSLIYTLVGAPPSAIIDLPPRWTRQGHDTHTHIVYDCCAPSDCQTVVFWAEHPLGYNMHTLQISGSQDMADAYSSASLNDYSLLNSWGMSNLNTISEGNSDFGAYESYEAPYPYSTHTHSAPHAEDEAHIAANELHDIDAPPASENTSTLQGIMTVYPKWQLVLAYLRLLIRVAILKGESENPNDITRTSSATRDEFIRPLFAQSLVRANTPAAELEIVVSTKDGNIISEREILVMAASWVYNFIYDCRRVAYEGIKHPRAGFGFGAIYGVALNARVEFVLKHFIPPLSTLLPIEKNGIVWFLQSRFAKSLLWHIVFRVTRPHGARIHTSPNLPQVVADLEPDAFKGASNPPLETLAFVGSFCFHALLRFLKRAIKAHRGLTSMEDYPTPREIHDQIIVTIIMLLQQHDDPGLPSLQAQMLQFCDLRTIDVVRIVRQ